MQVKGGATDSLDLSGTGSCAAFNFRRTARAVSRLYDHGLEPSGLRATQFAILTAIAKFQPVSISRIGEILVHMDISPENDARGIIGLGEPCAIGGVAAVFEELAIDEVVGQARDELRGESRQ